MENGVSSCGGRLVRPIIGRFCGYFTSGRSPLSKGNVTLSSASALSEPKPVASAANPARFINSRLSSIVLPPKLICRSRPHQDAPDLRLFHSLSRYPSLGSSSSAYSCEYPLARVSHWQGSG